MPLPPLAPSSASCSSHSCGSWHLGCEIFHEPALLGVLRVLAICSPIAGWSTTGLGLLTRDLRFGGTVGCHRDYAYLQLRRSRHWPRAGRRGCLESCRSVTYVGHHAGCVAIHTVRHPVRPRCAGHLIESVMSTRPLTLVHCLTTWVTAFALLSPGRSSSAAVVGQFNRAYYFAFQSIRIYLGEALANVLFSSLSAIQSDKARVRRVYLSVLCLGALALFPLCWHGEATPSWSESCWDRRGSWPEPSFRGSALAAAMRPFPFLPGTG